MATKKAAKKTLTRSAKTGKVVSPKSAKSDPDGTVTETILPLPELIKSRMGKFKIPKKMGTIADLLYSTREERLAVNKVVDEFKDRESQLKNYIIENLPKSEATGASGKQANVKVYNSPQYRVEDWDKFYAHIKKTGQFDLLNRALNQAAVSERYTNGKAVPGVGIFEVTKVSVTKV